MPYLKVKPQKFGSQFPEKIESFSFSKAPSDAIILFDGTDFSNWVTWGDKEPQWIINNDGSMTVVNGKGLDSNKRIIWVCSITY